MRFKIYLQLNVLKPYLRANQLLDDYFERVAAQTRVNSLDGDPPHADSLAHGDLQIVVRLVGCQVL